MLYFSGKGCSEFPKKVLILIGILTTVYSITETALLNGLKPYLYLAYVLDQLRRMEPFPKEEKLDQLLP